MVHYDMIYTSPIYYFTNKPCVFSRLRIISLETLIHSNPYIRLGTHMDFQRKHFIFEGKLGLHIPDLDSPY